MRRAVLTGVLAALTAACGPPPDDAPSMDAGVAPLTAVAPSGDTGPPIVFRWEGAGPDRVVRVHVFDDAERPLYGIEARGDHVAAPEPLYRLLQPGERYQWRVVGVDENGEEVGSSDLVGFRFR